MRVTILHNAILDESAPDEKDVLAQVAAISDALEHLGHDAVVLPCDLNLSALKQRLSHAAPNMVFNLVESLGQSGALIHLVPFFLAANHFPFTGAQADAMMLSSNKIMAKTVMRASGLPTPDWLGPYPATESPIQKPGIAQEIEAKTWIIKSVWEHASIGLDEDGLLSGVSADAVVAEMATRATDLGGACFAETFIEGREFNLSVLDGPDGPVVLPPAEIQFMGTGRRNPASSGIGPNGIQLLMNTRTRLGASPLRPRTGRF